MTTNRRAIASCVFTLMACLTLILTTPVRAQRLSWRLITGAWLERNLDKEDQRIIDIRDDVKAYWQGHIPGAVYLNPEAMRLADRGTPVKLMPPEALAIMLGQMGVSNTTTVVVYAEEGDYKAPYLVWALDYIGHDSVCILDGGFGKWQLDGRLQTQDYPVIESVEYELPAELHEEVRATLEEVKQSIGRPDTVLLDVRPAELYSGEKGFWKRNGHIQGAINRFWRDDLTEDGTWKGRLELADEYAALGVTPEKTIIVSCGQGQMSAQTYFTLKYILACPHVANYDGGFNEWSVIPDLPVETGAR